MEQTQTWFNKNKLIVIVTVLLGLFGIYAWKNNLTIAPYIHKQNPEPNIKNDPVTEANWREQFENDRK